MQEHVVGEDFLSPGGEGEHFDDTLFIVLCCRLLACAVTLCLLTTSGQSITPQAPLWNYALVSGATDTWLTHA